MNYRWKKADKLKINNSIAAWKHRAGLGNWLITTEFVQQPKDSSSVSAMISSSARYKEASLTVYPAILEAERSMDSIICHEITHVLLSPLIEICQDAMDGKLITAETKQYIHESVTTDVANALGWCLKKH